MVTQQQARDGRWRSVMSYLSGIVEDQTETPERRHTAARAFAEMEGTTWPTSDPR